MKTNEKLMVKMLIPRPQVVSFVYRKGNGVVDEYTVSVISKTTDSFCGYAEGHGVRSFRYDRILNLLDVE